MALFDNYSNSSKRQGIGTPPLAIRNASTALTSPHARARHPLPVRAVTAAVVPLWQASIHRCP